MSTNKLLYYAFFWILFGYLINRYIWSNQLVLLMPDIFVFILSIKNFKKISFNLIKPIFTKWIKVSVVLFISIGIISGIIHMINPIAPIWGVRMFIRYYLLLLLVVRFFKLSDVVIIHKWLYRAYYLNFIFCVIQLVMGSTGDDMGGLFGANGDMAIFLVIMEILFVFDYFRKRLSIIVIIIFIFLNYEMALWAEIKMLYFIIPIVLYSAYVIIKRFSIKHLIILIVGVISAGPILQFIISTYYDQEYVTETLNKESLDQYNNNSYGFTAESVNRGNCVEKITKSVLCDPLEFCIGYGIGSGSISQLFQTDVLIKYRKTYYYYFTMSYVLVEVGWLGLILLIITYTIITIGFFKVYYKTRDLYIKYWSGFGFLTGLFTYLFIYYAQAPYVSYYLPFFLWGVSCVAILEQKKG